MDNSEIAANILNNNPEILYCEENKITDLINELLEEANKEEEQPVESVKDNSNANVEESNKEEEHVAIVEESKKEEEHVAVVEETKKEEEKQPVESVKDNVVPEESKKNNCWFGFNFFRRFI